MLSRRREEPRAEHHTLAILCQEDSKRCERMASQSCQAGDCHQLSRDFAPTLAIDIRTESSTVLSST
jgi:hypothetical protein